VAANTPLATTAAPPQNRPETQAMKQRRAAEKARIEAAKANATTPPQ
jgi:hypothetical protein